MNNKKKLRLIRAVLFMIVFICLILIVREYDLSVSHRAQQEELWEKLQTENEGDGNGENGSDKSAFGRAMKAMSDPVKEMWFNSMAKCQELWAINREDKKEQAKEPVILNKYAGLYEENSDLTGWLSIDGMKINYPVMQCGDDEYYLHHDFYGNEDKYGCLYVRERADVNTPGTNVVIYGHNMRDGSMFGDLDFYKDEAFYEEHSIITFDTLY